VVYSRKVFSHRCSFIKNSCTEDAFNHNYFRKQQSCRNFLIKFLFTQYYYIFSSATLRDRRAEVNQGQILRDLYNTELSWQKYCNQNELTEKP